MHRVIGLCCFLLILAGAPASMADPPPRPILGAMTQNQYLGADLGELVAAPGEGFNAALVQLLQQIANNDFRARAREQAEIIARQRPDLVGLQEVLRLRCLDGPQVPENQGCDDPSIADAFVDHLRVTLQALRDLGVDYREAATVRNLDLRTLEVTLPNSQVITPGGIPFVINGVPALLVAIDRDVILARKETVRNVKPVEFSCSRESRDGCNFDVVLPVELTVPGAIFGVEGNVEIAVNFERGFVGVDATVRGRDYRFVNTHLEVREPQSGNPLSRFFQSAQAAQLISVLEATPPSRTLLVVGDINSSPEDMPILGDPDQPSDDIVPPYEQFVAAGLIDVWTLRSRRDPGFTCCQDPELRNPVSTLDERIDVIFTDTMPARFSSVRVVGDRISNQTPDGLWPSDHAGVLARLRFSTGDSRLAAR